jgi:CRP/FNR family transcriptional regulator, anaerobic regulatory protein
MPNLSAGDDCQTCPASSVCPAYQLGLVGTPDSPCSKTTIRRRSGELIIEHDAGSTMAVVRHGWIAGYVLFPDGRRQIVDVLMRGDLVGCTELVAPGKPGLAVALSDVEVCTFDTGALLSSISTCPTKAFGLLKACTVQAMRLRSQLAALGRQSAESRLAAFVSTLHSRLLNLNEATQTEMPFHFRQQDLADALGLTQVHISRTLSALRSKGVLAISGKMARLLDTVELSRLAQT